MKTQFPMTQFPMTQFPMTQFPIQIRTQIRLRCRSPMLTCELLLARCPAVPFRIGIPPSAGMADEGSG